MIRIGCVFIFLVSIYCNEFKDQGEVLTSKGNLKYNEDWGYVEVRQNAYTFWWLFAAEKVTPDRPLILWLQGGPGGSSTGFGNLVEMGPKHANGDDREHTWLQLADLVFVDNPVGAGFSFVNGSAKLTKNIQEIGEDLLSWAKTFFIKHSEYRSRPFYIFCESYGGKMATQFSKVILENKEELGINFQGVGLGDSWINPLQYVLTWGDFLYAKSLIDSTDLANLTSNAIRCVELAGHNRWEEATGCYHTAQDLISFFAHGISWYNNLEDKTDSRDQDPAPFNFMNITARKKFGIIPDDVIFGYQSRKVFVAQSEDFMKPIHKTVDWLLDQDLKVIVYNGDQDLICDIMGTDNWVHSLSWKGLDHFNQAKRELVSIRGNELKDAYKKSYKNFHFWWILNAGHMAPMDAPETVLQMLQEFIKN